MFRVTFNLLKTKADELQAEDGIRDLQKSRGLGDVYKRQVLHTQPTILR